MKKTLMLLILDGWGIRQESSGNAIKLANPSFYDTMIERFPNIALEASGEAVGLPEGQMGNSEVGHLNMGAGRIVYQEITRINKSIREGDFFSNPVFLQAVEQAKLSESTLHVMGMVSDGGVHSDLKQCLALIDFCKQQNVSKLSFHAFLDGRDTAPRSAEGYLDQVEQKLHECGFPQITTISGRYYAMDRDNRWERTQLAYDCIVHGKGRRHVFSQDALSYNYHQDLSDEFVLPSVTDLDYTGMHDGDAMLFFNYRPDRARQITRALTQSDFQGFDRGDALKNFFFGCMTLYDESFNLPVAYPKQKLNGLLAEVLSEHKLTQFRTAETEKYAHITFFFNGGFETPYEGETRHLVPSPKVATYDLQPAMNAPALTDVICDALRSGEYDVLIANYANPDMVGHTGILSAAEDAVKAIDECLKRVVDTVLEIDGTLLLTADHGNCEMMIADDGGPHTAHTTNLVPLILVSNRAKTELDLDRSKPDGYYSLSSVTTTMLDILNIPAAPQMTSPSILVKQGALARK
jgi:2,3-bisphosphoglycerate-independent phosphoglycerate mutase